MSIQNVSRRGFLKSTAVVGGGLVVGFNLTGCSEPGPLPIAKEVGSWVPNAFVQLLPDNTLKFYTARDEMGQGVTTGLSTICLLYTSPSPRDQRGSRMPSSA